MVTLNNQRVYDMLISPTMGIETKKTRTSVKETQDDVMLEKL